MPIPVGNRQGEEATTLLRSGPWASLLRIGIEPRTGSGSGWVAPRNGRRAPSAEGTEAPLAQASGMYITKANGSAGPAC